MARSDLIRSGLLAVAVLTPSAALAAGPLPPPPPDPHDLSGVWFGEGHTNPENMFFKPMGGGDAPFTPQGKAIFQHRLDAEAQGNPVRDPVSECMPYGVPRGATSGTPFQIVQQPGMVAIVYEASRDVRVIYMDEPQAVDPPRTFMGHSVGHWEGDTLVVDTVGLHPDSWIDFKGSPAGKALHIVERFKTFDGGKQLEDLITIDSPDVYAHPFTARRTYFWSPEERPQEYVCEESRRTEPGAVRPVYK